MKRNWNRLSVLVVAAGMVLGGAGPAAGQNQGDLVTAGVPAGSGLIRVHFPGGTVAEYAELLRASMRPAPANIAVSEEAGRKNLPTIDLDAVTLGTALGALQYIAPVGSGESWAVQMLSDEPPAYAVAVMREPASPTMGGGPATPDRMLQVFSIKELIDPSTPGGPSPETVLSAVDLALRMASPPTGEPPALKFHPDSGLIILDAPPQQVGAIESLLQRMRDDVSRQRDRMERAARERLENEVRLQSAAAKLEVCSARLDFAKQALDQVLKLQQSGNASTDDVRNAQMAMVNAKSDRDLVEIEMRAAKARIAPPPSAQSQDADPGETDALRSQVAQLTQQVAVLQAKIKEFESRKK